MRALIDESRGYWFQLCVSMGIATLGLVLGSAAVVIGAMLISPLMTPLVEIGMGLAVGSAVLVVRAVARTAISIVVVVGGAALLTMALPFHELTSEIAARTAPTALDLFVAALCALMAGFTTVRPPSGAASTAAGTAIGIALVPPLCVVGWGLGTARWDVAGGAILLFTANISAILLLTLAMFLLLGFGRVPVDELERDVPARTAIGRAITKPLRAALASRAGPGVRLVLPLVFAGTVYIPLRRALSEVAWEVRVRAAITTIVSRAAPDSARMSSSIVVEHHRVSVRLLVVGDHENARKLSEKLRTQIAAAAGVVPTVDVVAVPDAAELASLKLQPEPPPTPPTKPSAPDLAKSRVVIAAALDALWPAKDAGKILAWDLALRAGGATVLHVEHFGAPVGPSGLTILARALSDRLSTEVTVDERAFSATPVELSPSSLGTSWGPFQALVDGARTGDALHLCVTRAPESPDDAIAPIVTSSLATLPPGRATITAGDAWSARLSLEPCETGDAGVAPADAAAD